MIKEIPKPYFRQQWSSSQFYDWFDQTIEPLNKLIREGVEVYGSPDACKDTPIAECWYNDTPRGHTHKAILIGIEPIKKETAADVLSEFVSEIEKHYPRDDKHIDVNSFYKRAKAALANEGE